MGRQVNGASGVSSEGGRTHEEKRVETHPKSIFIISVAAAAWLGDVKEK